MIFLHDISFLTHVASRKNPRRNRTLLKSTIQIEKVFASFVRGLAGNRNIHEKRGLFSFF